MRGHSDRTPPVQDSERITNAYDACAHHNDDHTVVLLMAHMWFVNAGACLVV